VVFTPRDGSCIVDPEVKNRKDRAHHKGPQRKGKEVTGPLIRKERERDLFNPSIREKKRAMLIETTNEGKKGIRGISSEPEYRKKERAKLHVFRVLKKGKRRVPLVLKEEGKRYGVQFRPSVRKGGKFGYPFP